MNETLRLYGEYALWLAAIAGGIAGLRYIYKWLRDSGTWIADAIEERARKKKILAEITAPETEWPNGSTGLVDSHRNVYAAVQEVKTELGGVKTGVENIQHMLTPLVESQTDGRMET